MDKTNSDNDQVTQEYIDKSKEALDNLHYQQVLDICEDAKTKGINNPTINAAEASVLIRLKKYDEAQTLLEKSLKEFPDDPAAHYDLAIVFKDKDLQGEATKEAATALGLIKEANPETIDEGLLHTMSGALILLERYQEAIDYLEKGIARFPEDSSLREQLLVAYRCQSITLIKFKKYDEALALLEKSLKEFPDSPHLHYYLAITYQNKRRQSAAKKEAKRTIDILDGVNNDEIDEALAVCISGSLMILRRKRDAMRFLEFAAD